MMRPIACILGFHEWKTLVEEVREHEKGKHPMFNGVVRQEVCINCGWQRCTQFGMTSVKKPWEILVKKMKWDQAAQAYTPTTGGQ